MTITKRYGAISFLCNPTGRIAPRTTSEAHSIAGAIARAAELRRLLIERLTPRTGAVAFELIEDSDTNTHTVTLSKFGEVPNDSEIYEAVMEVIRISQEEGGDIETRTVKDIEWKAA